MKDFCVSAFPFVVIGLCVAVLCANHDRWKKQNHYMLPGMSIGVCVGLSLSAAGVFDVSLAMGAGLGILVGMTIGLFIKRKVNDNETSGDENH